MGGCGIGDLLTSNSGATAHRHPNDTRVQAKMTMNNSRNAITAVEGVQN